MKMPINKLYEILEQCLNDKEKLFISLRKSQDETREISIALHEKVNEITILQKEIRSRELEENRGN